jgi:hypothetical protein
MVFEARTKFRFLCDEVGVWNNGDRKSIARIFWNMPTHIINGSHIPQIEHGQRYRKNFFLIPSLSINNWMPQVDLSDVEPRNVPGESHGRHVTGRRPGR